MGYRLQGTEIVVPIVPAVIIEYHYDPDVPMLRWAMLPVWQPPAILFRKALVPALMQ